MVNSINGSGNDSSLIQDSALLRRTETEEVNRQAADNSNKVASLGEFNDTATVSKGAKRLYEADKFGRMAQQIAEPFDSDKVARLREMVQHGKISDILKNFDDADLAEGLINSPAGAFLR